VTLVNVLPVNSATPCRLNVIYQLTRRHISEDFNIQQHRNEKLKSRTYYTSMHIMMPLFIANA